MRDCFGADGECYPSDVLHWWTSRLVDNDGQPLPLSSDWRDPAVAGVALEGWRTSKDCDEGRSQKATYFFDDLLPK